MHEFDIFIWLAEKFGLEKYVSPEAISVFGSACVLLFIAVISLLAWRRLKNPEERIIPYARFSVANLMEVFTEWLLNIMRGVLGEQAEKFVPLIGTLFIYILCCNLIGFIPGFISPTSVILTNLACALVVFVYYNYIGFKENGVRYFKSFLGPVIWLAPLFIFIELISHLVRPITLSIRLYGNITGDHMVVGMFSELTPILVPIIFIILGIFVSLIQAFIFSILSTVYIALAVQHE